MTDDRHPSVSCDAWLDAHEVDDSLIARAYESVGGQGRAILKKNIARIHRLWGELPPREQLSRRFSRDFCRDLDDQPVSCALICCPAAFSHPAPLLAAVMPAVLAGVQSILPCFL